jgi:hypothetical protein
MKNPPTNPEAPKGCRAACRVRQNGADHSACLEEMLEFVKPARLPETVHVALPLPWVEPSDCIRKHVDR